MGIAPAVVWQTEHVIPGAEVRRGTALDFDAYVADQWEALWRLAYLVTGHMAEAEDIVQDVLIKVWPRWDVICARGDPGAYLRRCIANAKVSAWRKTRHETPYGDITASLSSLSDQSQDVVDALALAQALRGLNPRQRAAVALRYLEDRSYADIADICDTTQASARSLVRHALASLRQDLRTEKP